jgi:hypothetical protein
MHPDQQNSISMLQMALIVYHSARIGLIGNEAVHSAVTLTLNGLNASTWPVFLDLSFDFVLFTSALWFISSVWRKRNLNLNLVLLVILFFATQVDKIRSITKNTFVADRNIYIEQLVVSLSYLIMNMFCVLGTFLLGRKPAGYENI